MGGAFQCIVDTVEIGKTAPQWARSSDLEDSWHDLGPSMAY
jgi:hypothetical protein